MIRIVRASSEFGEITILRSRKDGSHVYCQGNCYQSQADRNGASLASYVHALYDLVLQADAREVLVIGCAGGTLGTMLANAGLRVTMVDVNPQAFVFARAYFALSPKVICHDGDGRAFLARAVRKYDAIVVDAYSGETIAGHLGTVEFFRLARTQLTRNGVLLTNVLLAHDLDPLGDIFAAGMVEAGLPAMVLDTPGEIDRNAIIIGGSRARPNQPKLLVATESLQETIADELAQMEFRAPRKAQALHDGAVMPEVHHVGRS